MNTKQPEHSLKYMRPAKAKKDGKDGYIYIHTWSTGWQELIFDTHELAQDFLKALNTPKSKTNEQSTQGS